MTQKRAIITITNLLTPSSMEFNEFVRYRAPRFPEEEHYLVSLAAVATDFLRACESQSSRGNIAILSCGGRFLKFRRSLNSLLKALKRRNIPVVVHFGHPRAALIAQGLNLLFLRNVPTLYTIHSSFNLYPVHNKVLTCINFFLAQRICFVSHAAFRAFPTCLLRIKKKKVCTIPNGVDLDRVDGMILTSQALQDTADDDSSARSPAADFKLINVGRLVKAKNQSWLIRLLPKLPERVVLTIIGEGELQAELEALARDLGVGHRLRLTGLMERERVYEELLTSQLFVASSIREGLPIAVLEAMAMRLPMLLSDIEPHKEIGYYGVSVGVTPLDTELWIARVNSLLTSSQAERKRLGKNNRKIVESHFSLKKMHEQYTRIYETLWNF